MAFDWSLYPATNFNELNLDWILENTTKQNETIAEQNTKLETMQGEIDNILQTTIDYDDLINKPSIGGVTLAGNKTIIELGGVTYSIIAPSFSSSNSYDKGEYVIYNGLLYRFIVNHSGTWDSNDVVSVRVGEDISELKRIIDDNTSNTYNINTAGSGRYAINGTTGVISVGGVNNFGMSDKVPCNPSTLYTVSFKNATVPSNATVYAAFYQSNGTFISRVYRHNNGGKAWSTATPSNAYYICFTLYTGNGITLSDGYAIQVEENGNASDYIKPESFVDEVARSDINTAFTPYSPTLSEFAGYIAPNGNIAAASVTNQEVYTNKVDVSLVEKVEWNLSYTTEKPLWICYATYDKTDTFIERITLVNSVDCTSTKGSFKVGDNVKYIRFSYRTFGIATFAANFYGDIGKIVENSPNENNVNRSSIGFNSLRFKPFYAHLFLDKITPSNATIPSESLFDVQAAKRLGFDVIEANVQTTSDGKYIVIHGSSGKFGGQVHHVDGVTDISNTAINSVSLSWIQTNVRYNSIYTKYRVTPPTLQEFLFECRKNCMIPLVTVKDSTMLAEIENIMGKDNYIAYGTARCSGAVVMSFPSLTSADEILAYCEGIGKPYMYCMANPTSFTDGELTAIVNLLHQHGYWIGIAANYQTEAEWQRVFSLGFDFAASGHQVNDFEVGNLCNLSSDIDYTDFTTTGTISDNLLTLENGETITPSATLSTVFLGKGSLHISFSGTITVSMGGYISASFTSDGSESKWFSTMFVNSAPTFTITATAETEIYNINYKASKV